MRPVRVIALGNEDAGDDGAAIAAARRLRPDDGVEIVIAGRPGVGLLELLDPKHGVVVLTDVVAAREAPGRIYEVPLSSLLDRSVVVLPVSSHGLGPAEALRLAHALGHALPDGTFVGIVGARFEPGRHLSPAVALAVDAAVAVLESAIRALRARRAGLP